MSDILSRLHRPSLSCFLLLLLALTACGGEKEITKVTPQPPRPVPADGAVEYTLRFPAAASHYVDVEAVFPTAGAAEIEVRMAVWTPGSYLVREYARHLEAFRAQSATGDPLTAEKSRKNRWLIQTGGSDPVVVNYRLYAREMTVRTNWVDADFAMLNGAPTFLSPVDGGDRTHVVRVELPDGWEGVSTGLPAAADAEHTYLAPDLDTLIDSPILVGNPLVLPFEVEGVPHELVHLGDHSNWNVEQTLEDVEKITRAQIEFWGHIPYERYVYQNVIGESGGGLEHLNSTLMLTGRWRGAPHDRYLGWLGLVSHEFFHTWNVKRLRPIELGPFDYENEVHTENLWIAEGVTSYYDDLLLRRAGVMTVDEYIGRFGGTIENVQQTPGRLVQSLSESSYDAWIKFYRPDENSRNTRISYYGKGAVVSFLLDAAIRRASGGDASLDDVLRAADAKYSGERGFTSEEFRALASETAGEDLSPFFATAVDGTDELDYGPALEWFGLRFKPVSEDDEGAAEDVDGWLGLRASDNEGRLIVRRVERGTPAHDAGFNVDDEVLAIDEYRVLPNDWSGRLKFYPPGTEAEILISRRGALRRLPVTFAEEPSNRWKLEIDPEADRKAIERRRAWLGEDEE